MCADYRKSHFTRAKANEYVSVHETGRAFSYWHELEQPLLDNIFQHLAVTHEGPLLDYATGTGRIIKVASRYFSQCVGMDISMEMLRHAKNRCQSSHFICGDLSESRIFKTRFEVITLFRFLLNAQQPLRRSILSALRDLMTPDGVLICNNQFNYTSFGALLRRAFSGRGTNPIKALKDSDLRRLLAECGFRVVKSYGLGIIPGSQMMNLPSPESCTALERILCRFMCLKHFAENRIYCCEFL